MIKKLSWILGIGGTLAIIFVIWLGYRHYTGQISKLNTCREDLGKGKTKIESLNARIATQNAVIEKNARYVTDLLKEASRLSNEARRNIPPLPEGVGAKVMNKLQGEL